MASTVQEIYTQLISALPPTERFQLATLILNGLVQQDAAVVDVSDTWTGQDQLDLATFSLQYSAAAFPEDEEMTE
jgi:hypothetical protein